MFNTNLKKRINAYKMRVQDCPYYKKFDAYKLKVLALTNDSLEKTIVVSLALCFVCAVLVSFSAVVLRPLQIENKAMDMKRNILDVAGLLDDNTDIHQTFMSQIDEKLIDIVTGEYVEGMNVTSYNQRKAAKDATQNILIAYDKDVANIKRKAKIAKIYLVKKGTTFESIILPVHGYGLWSTMYGFLALETDGQTVRSISFYDQAETPGLGGEVVNPHWRALWKGKKVYNATGEPKLTLVKGVVDNSKANAEFQIDGLAGATLTSNGVSNLIKYWMGAEGFAPYLNNIKKHR